MKNTATMPAKLAEHVAPAGARRAGGSSAKKSPRTALPAAGLTLLLAALLLGCPTGYVPSYTVELTKDVVYGTGVVSDGADPPTYGTKDLLLDVYYPGGSKGNNKPAMILIHGGSFVEGEKEKEEIVDIAMFFARRGYVCFSIDYRLVEDHPPGPSNLYGIEMFEAAHASFVDTKAAIRWVRANSGLYGIDPDLIVVVGESAGAIAAVTAAVTDDDDYAVDAPEFPIPPENHPEESARVQGCVDLWGSGTHVADEFDPWDPPMMILHGEDDDRLGVSFVAAQILHGLCELYGIPHEFYPIPDEGHGAWDARVNGKGIKLLILDFLNEHVVP